MNPTADIAQGTGIRRPFDRTLFKSLSVEWATPKHLYDALNAEFSFDFDPCPLGGCENALSPLFVEWTSRRVFCNPPYGNISEWLNRGREADVAVFLIPARTDTRWFHELVLPYAAEIRFVRGRVKFQPNDPKWKSGGGGAPFPSMIVIFRKDLP